jgi:phage host-nuclease inhibitor protein Gam
MSRQKPKNIFLVRDLEEADRSLAEIGEIKRKIGAVELELNERIAQLKAEAAAECAPLAAKMEALETGVLVFAELNRAELFAEKKTIALAMGKIGYRKSTKVKPRPNHLGDGPGTAQGAEVFGGRAGEGGRQQGRAAQMAG